MYRIRSNVTEWSRNLIEPGTRRRVGAAMTMFVALGAFLWMDRDARLVAQSQVETVQTEIRAQSFVVVDNAGKERGVFGILPSGQAGVRIWDAGKTIAATFEIDQRGMPRMAFEKTDGTPLVQIGVYDKQYPVFILSDGAGIRRLGLAITNDGTINLILNDTSKKSKCRIAVGSDGEPRIVLHDKRGEARVSLMVANDGMCAVELFDQEGQSHVVFVVDDEGHADAAVLGRDGKAIWSTAGNP